MYNINDNSNKAFKMFNGTWRILIFRISNFQMPLIAPKPDNFWPSYISLRTVTSKVEISIKIGPTNSGCINVDSLALIHSMFYAIISLQKR